MLRINLASRPFYNERAVYFVLGLVAVVGVVALLASVLQLVDLARRNGELTARANSATRSMADLTARTAAVQREVSSGELAAVADATREANTLIDQRVFSWTDFFNRIETTLPADVMVTEVRPEIAPGSVEVTMGVLGRRLDDVSDFVMALEESGAFTQVLNRQAELTEDGMYQAVLRGRYLESTPPGVGGTVPSSDATDQSEPIDTSDAERPRVATEPDEEPVPGDSELLDPGVEVLEVERLLESPSAAPVDVDSNPAEPPTREER